MAPATTSRPPVEHTEPERTRSFAVPDDLGRDAVARSNPDDTIADWQLIPGAGEGSHCPPCRPRPADFQ
jgi:hypothetical protein